MSEKGFDLFDLIRKSLIGTIVAYLAYFLVRRFSKQPNLASEQKVGKPNSTEPFLNKADKKPIKLSKRNNLSHDSAVLRFSLDNDDRLLGLPVGKHFKIVMKNPKGVEEGKWNGREDPETGKEIITRSYTPTSGDENLGFVDLLIKFYLPGVKQQFPDGGKVSRQLHDLTIGDDIFIQGPFGRVEYKGRGLFKIGSKEVNVKEVGMMAGGSGITPMLQIARYSLKDEEDETKFSLIFANQTEEDILLREELEQMAKEHAGRFRVHFTLDRPADDWKHSKGFITAEMIQTYLPPPAEETLMLMCGPPPMVKFACRANMDKLGYSKASQVEF